MCSACVVQCVPLLYKKLIYNSNDDHGTTFLGTSHTSCSKRVISLERDCCSPLLNQTPRLLIQLAILEGEGQKKGGWQRKRSNRDRHKTKPRISPTTNSTLEGGDIIPGNTPVVEQSHKAGRKWWYPLCPTDSVRLSDRPFSLTLACSYSKGTINVWGGFGR